MKILVAYDGSEIARRALAAAQKRAKALNAVLCVFTSANGGDSEGPKTARLEAALKDAEMMCGACGISCQLELSPGTRPAADELIQFARENDIDEIVIGLRKRSQLGKILFGSTSRQVILEAPCPVLTVK